MAVIKRILVKKAKAIILVHKSENLLPQILNSNVQIVNSCKTTNLGINDHQHSFKINML